MAKKNFSISKNTIVWCLITYAILLGLLLFFVFRAPKKTQETITKKEQIAKVEVAKGNVSVLKTGEINLYGEGIKLDLDTTSFLSITKYREPEWMISANYGFSSSELDLSVGKRIIGGFFIVGGVRANLDPLRPNLRGVVGVSLVF